MWNRKNLVAFVFPILCTVLILGVLGFISRFFLPKKPEATTVFYWAPNKTWHIYDECQKKDIKITVNEHEGRGRRWTEKFPGTRIIAVGESSTFGVNNDDADTWPVKLEEALYKKYKKPIEVLNAGKPGTNLFEITTAFESKFKNIQFDYLIYYGGYNEVVGQTLADFHNNNPIGKMLLPLYNKFSLYTLVAEKIFFLLEQNNYEPDTSQFHTNIDTLTRLARKHGAKIVFVLQATKHPLKYSKVTMNRLFKTEALQYYLSDHYPVIDPRQRLKNQHFCDEVHLTDDGNNILADYIAENIFK